MLKHTDSNWTGTMNLVQVEMLERTFAVPVPDKSSRTGMTWVIPCWVQSLRRKVIAAARPRLRAGGRARAGRFARVSRVQEPAMSAEGALLLYAELASLPPWKCQDGRLVHIFDMETSHIENCVAMLRRKGHIAVYERRGLPVGPPHLQGEYAQMAAEQEWLDECDRWAAQQQKVNPWIDAFEAELKRRKACNSD